MKILICGFMGAGKSYWLQELRQKSPNSELIFWDLDQEIAHYLKILPSKLGDWILAYGWEAFRATEQVMIQNFFHNKSSGLLAMGGGSLNQAMLATIKKNQNTKMIFLDTPFSLCCERITSDTNRPLALLSIKELRALYDERLPLYKQANLILNECERKEIDGITSLVHTLYGL